MRLPWLVLLIVPIACGGDDDQGTAADAAIDASVGARTHTIYLDFDGVTLAAGSADDATQNLSSIATGPTTLPMYLGSDAERATKIAAITAEVQNILAPYDVAITTTRPASGTYFMVVTTDASSSVLACTNCPALAPADCGADDAPVAFNFGSGAELPVHGLTADTVAMAGLAVLGIPTSAVPNDCMCFADANCTFPPTQQCAIGGAGTAISTSKPGCPTTQTVMDENALFLAGYGPQ